MGTDSSGCEEWLKHLIGQIGSRMNVVMVMDFVLQLFFRAAILDWKCTCSPFPEVRADE
jgi:hypothetical protein